MSRLIVTSFCLLLLISIFQNVNSARILGVFPLPSVSHQVVFAAYTEALAKQGHELVIITPNPQFKGHNENITEIDVSFTYRELRKMHERGKKILKRGVIADIDIINSAEAYRMMIPIIAAQFDHKDIQELIANKQHFGLIIAETFLEFPLVFTKIFNAPAILISSYYGFPEQYELIGAVARHPMLYPNFQRNKFGDLSYWETIYQIYIELKLWYQNHKVERDIDATLKAIFGQDAPTSKELRDNVAMLFLNSHPVFTGNRPVPPSVLYLGGLHLKPPKELPQDLKTYLDNSKRGVIYVSFGSNVNPTHMHQEFLDTFLEAFASLPYDILWKFDGDNLENMPKNLKIQKWFPQRDLLLHPNIKAFVTQGGFQSTDEAIDAGVPLVGIPMWGDQWYNTHKYVELGIGIKLDALTLRSDDLVEAVKTVIANEHYRKNIRKLRDIFHDQPSRPVDRAVWWTEHILRHGYSHLRAPAANMSWPEFLMLDKVLPVLAGIVLVLVLSLWLLWKVIRIVLRIGVRSKEKQS